MWFSRKFAPLFPIAILIGGTISLWKKTAIEAYTAKIALRVLLYITPAFAIFVVLLAINVTLICRFGRLELEQRLNNQWTERFRAHIDNRTVDYRFEDILDYIAYFVILYCKVTYKLHLWNWQEHED